jgi:tetratricopeptide (TPR) repeat protein
VQYPYYKLSLIYIKKGKLQLAEKFLKKCIELDPTSDIGIKAKIKLEELNE